MALTNAYIQEKLVEKFNEQVFQFSTDSGILSFESAAENNLKVLQFLYEESSLGFTFLTDLCGVNYPDNNGAELVVVYHLHNFIENIRIRFSIGVPVAKPDVFTATKLFESAKPVFEKKQAAEQAKTAAAANPGAEQTVDASFKEV